MVNIHTRHHRRHARKTQSDVRADETLTQKKHAALVTLERTCRDVKIQMDLLFWIFMCVFLFFLGTSQQDTSNLLRHLLFESV